MIVIHARASVSLQEVVETMRSNRSFVDAQNALIGSSKEYERELSEQLDEDSKAQAEGKYHDDGECWGSITMLNLPYMLPLQFPAQFLKSSAPSEYSCNSHLPRTEF